MARSEGPHATAALRTANGGRWKQSRHHRQDRECGGHHRHRPRHARGHDGRTEHHAADPFVTHVVATEHHSVGQAAVRLTDAIERERVGAHVLQREQQTEQEPLSLQQRDIDLAEAGRGDRARHPDQRRRNPEHRHRDEGADPTALSRSEAVEHGPPKHLEHPRQTGERPQPRLCLERDPGPGESRYQDEAGEPVDDPLRGIQRSEHGHHADAGSSVRHPDHYTPRSSWVAADAGNAPARRSIRPGALPDSGANDDNGRRRGARTQPMVGQPDSISARPTINGSAAVTQGEKFWLAHTPPPEAENPQATLA